ncbi:MAG: hypothetical protein ACQEVA_13650 [Myxococcota bacterium]
MSKWTNHHQALLDALRADRIGPPVYACVADGAARDNMSSDLLRDWVTSMRADPGWRALEHVYDNPNAFPDAWDRATELGWSGRTDHHNALFFEDFTLDHLHLGNIERARWSWRHCLEAWSRCAASDYYRDLLDTLSDEADASVIAQANRRVLEPPAHALAEALRDALAVESGVREQVDADRADDIMSLVRQLADREPDAPNSPLQHGAATMREQLDGIVRELLSAFERAVDALDMVDDDQSSLLAPFERLREQFDALRIDDESAISVVDTTVAIIWKLRKLDRPDEDDIFVEMLDATRPFAEQLVRALSEGRAMGRQSLAADYLVFRGEQLVKNESIQFDFERALELCPGHRNASKMLSYMRLSQALAIISELSLLPGPIGKLPRVGEHIEASIHEAHDYVEEAASIFPTNERLPEYRSDIRGLADRFDVEL